MKDQWGCVWNVEGLDEDIATRCDKDYAPDRSELDEFCLQVRSLPQEEKKIVLNYVSNWKNNKSITASPLAVYVGSVVMNVLTNSEINGNPSLFNAFNAAGVEHSDAYSYNSMELKKIVGTLDLSGNADIQNMSSNGKSVLKYLKNVFDLVLDGCIGLNEDIDLGDMRNLKTLSLSGVTANTAIRDTNEQLTSVAYGSPSAIEIGNCPRLANLSIEDAANVESVTIGNTAKPQAIKFLLSVIEYQ